MDRFIQAFRDVVLATTPQQMHALFESLIINGRFPKEAVDHVRKEYYDNPKAHQFMECYVYGCGNLHQTTTSRNEGSHAAYRSKTNVIPKPAEAYIRRRLHKREWMQRLRAQASNARNRIPLDIQNVRELRCIAGKISIFAITQIRQQVILAKKEEERYGRIIQPPIRCNCHTYVRYGLPCTHMVPTDGTPIALEHISPMWRIDNWNQGLTLIS